MDQRQAPETRPPSPCHRKKPRNKTESQVCFNGTDTAAEDGAACTRRLTARFLSQSINGLKSQIVRPVWDVDADHALVLGRDGASGLLTPPLSFAPFSPSLSEPSSRFLSVDAWCVCAGHKDFPPVWFPIPPKVRAGRGSFRLSSPLLPSNRSLPPPPPTAEGVRSPESLYVWGIGSGALCRRIAAPDGRDLAKRCPGSEGGAKGG